MNSSLYRYLKLDSSAQFRLVVFLGLAFLQFIVVAPLPFVVKEIFDSAIDDGRFELLVGLCILILILQILSHLIGLVSSNLLFRLSSELVKTLRQTMFDKLYELSIRFHETNSIGDRHDRVVHETERIDMMTQSFAIVIPSLIFAIGILSVLAFINGELFLVTLAMVPIVYIINHITRKGLKQTSQQLHASVETLSESTFDMLRTMRQSRVLGAENYTRSGEKDMLISVADSTLNYGMMTRFHLSLNSISLVLWTVLILMVGGASVINEQITFGELFSFYAGIALIRDPINQLVQSIPNIVAGKESLRRVFELLDTYDPCPYIGERQFDFQNDLSLQQVSFEYPGSHQVLIDINLHIGIGEVIALTGSNGSGKTTLASLIVGIYKPNEGQITIDGIDYQELDLQYLRRQFGVLLQEPVMIAGTVRENIIFGRPEVTESELVQALESAGAVSLIEDLEHGLETLAYHGGPLLSGGQLQRIALTRALLGSPRLLILDEPTNHLDLSGLRNLLINLRSLQDAPAIILITHSEEVAMIADSNYEIKNKRLARA